MQTIGERLEEARKKKGASIREAAEATKIRSDYLHQFESNHFELNLAEIYVRGFLRSYAAYLQLPVEKILSDYTALQRPERKQRQLSREDYGRMDLSSSAPAVEEPSSEHSPDRTADSGASGQGSRQPSPLHRSGSSLPKGPAIDPNVLFKGGIVVLAVIVLLLVIWGVKSLFTGGHDSARAAATPAAAAQVQNQPTITLIALNPVSVRVVRKNADGTEGDVLLPETLLQRGDTRSVVKPGPILIWASEGRNLEVEVQGKRYPMPFTGRNRAQIN